MQLISQKEVKNAERSFNYSWIGVVIICFTAIFCFAKMAETSSETKEIEQLKIKKLELETRNKEADVKLEYFKLGKTPEYRSIIITDIGSHVLTTSYQCAVSSRWNIINYSVQINSSLSLTGGQTGTVVLQTSPDNATWTTISTAVNGNTGSLTLGLNTLNSQTVQMLAVAPPGYYYRLLPTGTSSMAVINGRELAF